MRIHSPQITGSAANTNIVLTTITSSISVLSASFASTASYWSGSIINAASASYWSGSIINAATASYILNAVSASYVLNAISSSFAETASFANNFTVGGTLTAQTINVQTITSSIDFVTGSSINGSLLSNTHQITGSTSITGSLAVNGSNVILTNQTSSMSVATASYWSGSIINAASASYWSGSILNATSASYALTASYLNPITNSYVILSQVSQSLNFVDDDAAAVGGVPLGGLYRNGNFILIRVGGSEGPFYYEIEGYQTCGGSLTYGPIIVLSTVPVIVGKWFTMPPIIYPFPLYLNVLSTAVPTEGAIDFSSFFTNPRDTCAV